MHTIISFDAIGNLSCSDNQDTFGQSWSVLTTQHADFTTNYKYMHVYPYTDIYIYTVCVCAGIFIIILLLLAAYMHTNWLHDLINV